MNGFYRIAAAVPQLEVAHPSFNAEKISELYIEASRKGAALVLFPELALTGSSCGDLFEQKTLLDEARDALLYLASLTADSQAILVVGLPCLCGNRLFNTAAVCSQGKVNGFAVKEVIPSFKENMEKRYFSPASSAPQDFVLLDGDVVPFASDIVFETSAFSFAVSFGSELSSPASQAPSLAAAGAQIILSPAAAGETLGASRRRRTLLESESERLVSCIVQANAGVYESSGEGLCAGEALIAVNGTVKARNNRFERCGNLIFSDLKPAWIDLARRALSSFNDAPVSPCARIFLETPQESPDLAFASLEQNPFIPADPDEAASACAEIFEIQSGSLAKRFTSCFAKRMVIGLSGGLDSTLALLVCTRCCDLLQLPRNTILAVTMPGFGTSGRTKNNARIIAEHCGAELRTISIAPAVEQHFKDIGHDPQDHSVVYENSQARERTQILMDIANAVNGIVIGTGDLSEIALGWSTFNGDHMSMYNVNCSVPKTLMRTMVLHAAALSPQPLAEALTDICNTPVSPELLPGAQHTENIIGPYQLHDFFLWHLLRHGEDQQGLLALASGVFDGVFSQEEIRHTCDIFWKRFFTQQFKRNASPEGPRVSPCNLTPSSWHTPSDSAFFHGKKSLAKKAR